MRSIGRLLVWYLLAGVAVATLDNWMAHTRAGSSIVEILAGSQPTPEKTAALYDLVLFPIFVWPVRIMELLKG